MRKSFHAVVLPLCALPLIAAPCTEEKVVDLVIGFPTTVLVQAEGSVNVNVTSGLIDVKAQTDVQQGLDDAGIDVSTLSPADITVAAVFYRVASPDAEPTRTVTGGVGVARANASGTIVSGGQSTLLISNWTGQFGVGAVDPNQWIDITNTVGAGGLALMNQYIADCITSLQTNKPLVDPFIKYYYNGVSTPQSVNTSFQYEIKVLFQGVAPQTFEVPFG